MSRDFELFLFAREPTVVREATAAGVDGVVIDWERFEKHERQSDADTQISGDTADDLARVRAATKARVICRINPFGAHTGNEMEQALDAGADEVLLPMIRSADEVDATLELARSRCGVGILVETEEAVQGAAGLGTLPIARAYVGLNDLAIARNSASIFDAVADGTVERIRDAFQVPFGFAGLTRPERGVPVPCRLLIAEMVRLGCSFSFLRRSYQRDVARGEQRDAIVAIHDALDAAAARKGSTVDRDRRLLERTIAAGSQPLVSG